MPSWSRLMSQWKALNGGVSWINMRIDPAVSISEALPKIEAVFKKLIPTTPFDYKFVDEEYALKFSAEERINKLAGIFAVVAIFISCLGLFGLVSFVAEQRRKEIGVRKILGASVVGIWNLLSKDFLVLIIISFVIAAPIAWYGMNKWLLDYNYRINIGWEIFGGAGVMALFIALFTVSFQAIRAALAKPVKTLRTE